MKRVNLLLVFMLLVYSIMSQVHISYLWHMQQPIYWPEKSKTNPNQYQSVMESHNLKISGDSWNVYSDGQSHPLNNLEEIFSKADRVKAYQHGPKNSVERLLNHPNGGAQVNYSGCLIENVNSLANGGTWGYYSGWENNFATAKGWATSGGHPRMDMIGFTFHHALSPLISERALAKEIQAHKHISTSTFGGPYSKGYWPAECSFSERIIKVLSQEGIEWSVIANSHLSRTLNDYPLNYGTSGCNIDPPNGADKVSTNGNNWWNGQIDGRGGTFAAPYCYQAHKAMYIDPETGTEYKIDVVPMCDLISYQNGYSSMGTGDIESNIAPYSVSNQPSIVLMAHDGDNAWGGGDSYYQESVPNLANEAASKGYDPTTIQQFLSSNPVPENDIVRVEDGSWVNAENDWGHPQFINWLWPLYETTNYRFNPDGWTEDARNWAVITAAENYVITAEDLAGSVNIADIVSPNSGSSNAEKAWHFFLPSLTSGYMYYGKSLDMEMKQTIAGNIAIEHAVNEINAHGGADNTPPSVFIPQRFPYNPGGKGFGPVYGYQEFDNSSDFHVWTFAYDVSGLQSVVLKYRTDSDGANPLTNNENDIYVGGSGVSSWNTVNMATKIFPNTNVTNDPEIDFFELPTAIAELCYAEVRGLSEVLVDYYVEATDTKGNVFKTPIQHVYVGQFNSSNEVTLNIEPQSGNYPDAIEVSMAASTTAKQATPIIYYTLDGTEPNNTSIRYTNPFIAGCSTCDPITVKAIAYDSDGNVSEIISRRYTFGTPVGYDIYFKNTGNWSDVYVYLFDRGSGEALPGWVWPGTAMLQEQGSPWYLYTIEENVEVGIVFNNNNQGQQSDDLFRNYDGWFVYNENTWYDNCPGDCPGVVEVPVLSVDISGGTHQSLVTVSLSATNEGNIYYTTNGDTPTQLGTAYTGELTFTETVTLKALAFNSAGVSNLIDEMYTIIPVTGYNVHFKNTNSWNDVYIYLFNKNTSSSLPGWTWPGVAMAREQGSQWYNYTIEEPVEVGIVFNNNNQGQQAPDQYRTYDGWFNFSDASWYDTCPGDCPGETPEGLRLHYYNSNNWGSVYLYYWNTTPVSLTTVWPGVRMTDSDGDGWFDYTLNAIDCANVIFSNNGSSQTGDLYVCDEGWYDNGWKSAKKQVQSTIENSLVQISEPYPNPFTNNISFDISGIDKAVVISVYDIDGSKIFVDKMDVINQKLTLPLKLNKGIFYIKIETQHLSSVFKIVK